MVLICQTKTVWYFILSILLGGILGEQLYGEMFHFEFKYQLYRMNVVYFGHLNEQKGTVVVFVDVMAFIIVESKIH